jgi:hypothetical protein
MSATGVETRKKTNRSLNREKSKGTTLADAVAAR